MQRNNDLIRSILLAVEKQATGNKPVTLTASTFRPLYPELPDDILDEHIHLLVERGFLEAAPHQLGWLIMRLTWDGHDFLLSSQVESVWQKAKNAAGNLPFDVFVSTLKACAATYATSLIT
jgi:hypothetical protein